MTVPMELVAPNLTASEFKIKIIEFIKSRDFKAELLREILSLLPNDKRMLFEEYRADNTMDPISEDSYKWEREGGAYFALQLHMAEENFCLKRIEHIIKVKSHLTERGIAGFSRPVPSSIPNHEEAKSTKENTMSVEFSSVDLSGFIPSRSLSNSMSSDDLSSIRISLFMEMNDKRLTTKEITQAIAWTLSKYPTLFVAYEENAYSQKMVFDTTQWSKDYYHMQKVYASSNFSFERIRHMVAVREHVFAIPQDDYRLTTLSNARSVNTQMKSPQHQEQLSSDNIHRTEFKNENNLLRSLLLIGGAVGAIALVILAVIV